MGKQLRRVAVDLTPVLPGGANGGAKIFVIELLDRLARLRPEVEFILLTQAASHEELAVLDRPNMRRQMVLGSQTEGPRSRLKDLARRVLPRLPGRVQRGLARLAYKINAMLKRASAPRTLLHDMGADLLFCPFTAPTYFELGTPTVCTIYDLQYKTHPEFFAAADVAHRDNTFIEACKKATLLTAISDYSRDTAIKHGNVAPQRIRTIYLRMAQRIAQTANIDTSVLARLGVSSQQYLIYPANFWKHKNHEMLLTAFGMACRGGLPASVKLVCTGAPGPRQEWLAQAVAAMNLQDRVVFPGYLPNDELSALISQSAGVVFPSLYEGFGLPVVEAMAAGVPVACSNTTSLPEVAAGAAALFDPRIPTQIAQAMTDLVLDPVMSARFVAEGHARAAEFSDANRMAAEYAALFEDALRSEKRENLVTGIYADHWAGRQVGVQVAASPNGVTLEIEIHLPEWVPAAQVLVQATRDGEPCAPPLKVKRGARSLLSIQVDTVGGHHVIDISPTFVPVQAGHGQDSRDLSAMVAQCGLRAGRNYTDLRS